MAIVEYFKKHIRTLLVTGVFSFSNCVTYDGDPPFPEKPWYNLMCEDFHRRLARYRNVDPDSLQALLERCEKECPDAIEEESLRFCADIFCCRHASQECSYTGEKPDRFSDGSAYYEGCMLHYDIEPLRIPQ